MSWKMTANETVPIGTFEILKAGIVLPPAAAYFAGTIAPSAKASLSSSIGTIAGPRPPPRTTATALGTGGTSWRCALRGLRRERGAERHRDGYCQCRTEESASHSVNTPAFQS